MSRVQWQCWFLSSDGTTDPPPFREYDPGGVRVVEADTPEEAVRAFARLAGDSFDEGTVLVKSGSTWRFHVEREVTYRVTRERG